MSAGIYRATTPPGRVQSIYDASLIQAVPSKLIQGVSFRRDGKSTGTFLAHTYIFTIHMSSVGVPAARGRQHHKLHGQPGKRLDPGAQRQERELRRRSPTLASARAFHGRDPLRQALPLCER